jgi:hypothetical protein
MEINEIEEIKATAAEEAKEKIDPTEDDAIANLGESAGWGILMKKINKKICELLEPVHKKDISSDTNLELVGAMAIARSGKIEELRWIQNQVESVKNAKREMAKSQKPKSGESKTEA